MYMSIQRWLIVFLSWIWEVGPCWELVFSLNLQNTGISIGPCMKQTDLKNWAVPALLTIVDGCTSKLWYLQERCIIRGWKLGWTRKWKQTTHWTQLSFPKLHHLRRWNSRTCLELQNGMKREQNRHQIFFCLHLFLRYQKKTSHNQDKGVDPGCLHLTSSILVLVARVVAKNAGWRCKATFQPREYAVGN